METAPVTSGVRHRRRIAWVAALLAVLGVAGVLAYRQYLRESWLFVEFADVQAGEFDEAAWANCTRRAGVDDSFLLTVDPPSGGGVKVRGDRNRRAVEECLEQGGQARVVDTLGTSDRSSDGRPRNDSSSSSWLAVGEDAARSMADLRDPMTGQPVPKEPGWLPAILSKPVDILRTGTFEFVAGPLPDGSTEQIPGMGLPPDAGEMLIFQLQHDVRFEERADGRYVVTRLKVEQVKRPYHGLRMWFLWSVG